MSKIKFSDGEEFDTSCEPQIIKRRDGFYVMGRGTLMAVRDYAEGKKILKIIFNIEI